MLIIRNIEKYTPNDVTEKRIYLVGKCDFDSICSNNEEQIQIPSNVSTKAVSSVASNAQYVFTNRSRNTKKTRLECSDHIKTSYRPNMMVVEYNTCNTYNTRNKNKRTMYNSFIVNNNSRQYKWTNVNRKK